MAGPMARGAVAELTRELPHLRGVVVGVQLSSPEPLLAEDLVVATLLCDTQHRVLSDEHMVFFNQLTEPAGTVEQRARSRGDDLEQVEVDLDGVPADVARIVVVAYLNGGNARRRTLGQLREARIRLLDLADDSEVVRSENLAPALSTETGLVLGELYRRGAEWRFKVVGQGYADGVVGIAADHGVAL
ncbi:TerD family protein [Cellulomonas gilvus]|uniref:Stress protein n=1 Tax=Cellulomonas gilvus (strain ATCC 13127 / NRRL B-14078) TaxID=593907 RepID=F8A7B6_CELGA|nr:TerD family protein [Cellulomonas gilvus]AEI11174.1 stress protein [Cellulomonas gilvus ATCC 13127]